MRQPREQNRRILEATSDLAGRIYHRRGAEWEVPRLSSVLEINFFLPILTYFIVIQIVGYWIRRRLWTEFPPFKRHRLQNLTVSLIHSCITGSCSLLFFITHSHIMLEDTLHWYNPVAAQLTFFSLAYFLCDAVDIMRNDLSRYAFEVLAHHIVAVGILSIGLLSHKFLPYTYWALLVEVNTLFLHIRSIMRAVISDPVKDARYNAICLLNIFTFFVFRFGVLLWMMNFMVVNYGKFHPFYTYSALGSELFFFILSAFLLQRLLNEDGILEKRDNSEHRT